MEEQAGGSTSLRKIKQEQPNLIRARHTAGLFMLKQLTICRHSAYHNCNKFSNQKNIGEIIFLGGLCILFLTTLLFSFNVIR